MLVAAAVAGLAGCSISNGVSSLENDDRLVTRSVAKPAQPEGIASEDAEIIKTVVAESDEEKLLAWQNPETGNKGTITAIDNFGTSPFVPNVFFTDTTPSLGGADDDWLEIDVVDGASGALPLSLVASFSDCTVTANCVLVAEDAGADGGGRGHEPDAVGVGGVEGDGPREPLRRPPEPRPVARRRLLRERLRRRLDPVADQAAKAEGGM